jgi:DNA-binding transcriptional regulator YiaG
MCSTQVQQYAERLSSMRGSARKGMTPMSDDLTFIRGNERIERLAERPDLAEDVARVRRDMEDADRTYAMGLAALRQAADLTQVELARKLGVSQAAVSRIEQPHDLLLSTLNAYLQAVGGHARVIVQFTDGHEVDLDLSSLTATRGELELTVHAPGH